MKLKNKLLAVQAGDAIKVRLTVKKKTRRNDDYGGSEENRMRFAVEIAECVRSVWPQHKPLFMRLSVEDNAGWDPDKSVALARLVKSRGVDVIDCSSGGMRGAPVVGTGPVGYSYQVPYAEKLRKEADIMSMAVGLIVHADQAEQISVMRLRPAMSEHQRKGGVVVRACPDRISLFW